MSGSTTNHTRDDLVQRVRALLADEPSTREVSMFGGRSFMVDDAMVVAARTGGALLVRVPRSRHDDLLARPGAHQAEMGTGRTMGPGWISVAPEAVTTEESLTSWLEIAMEHHRGARDE